MWCTKRNLITSVLRKDLGARLARLLATFFYSRFADALTSTSLYKDWKLILILDIIFKGRSLRNSLVSIVETYRSKLCTDADDSKTKLLINCNVAILEVLTTNSNDVGLTKNYKLYSQTSKRLSTSIHKLMLQPGDIDAFLLPSNLSSVEGAAIEIGTDYNSLKEKLKESRNATVFWNLLKAFESKVDEGRLVTVFWIQQRHF